MAQAWPDLAPLARLAIHTAVRLQSGQDLIITAPLEAAPLVRQLACEAYRHGARDVACVYEDPELLRSRLVDGHDAALDHAAPWLSLAVADALRGGAALLRVLGPYPDLLDGIAPERILRAHAGTTPAPTHAATKSCALPFATRAWARQVYPELPPDVACTHLWQRLFAAMRLDEPDPAQAWQRHLDGLSARRASLQALGLAALRLRGAGTDLRIALAPGRRWCSADPLPSLPWEEVSVALDSSSAEGHVAFSRPLALGGTLVRGLRAVFRGGRATQLTADSGAEQVAGLFAAEVTRQVHTIGLVPASSRIARQETPFCVPILDRQAASHLGFGPAAGLCIECMFGSATTEIDGLLPDGRSVPVMRAGEFVGPAQ